MTGELPDSNDPTPWLHVVDELLADWHRALEWHASVEIDGEAATIRRACDVVLGAGAPLLLEVGPGQVLELDTNHQGEEPT